LLEEKLSSRLRHVLSVLLSMNIYMLTQSRILKRLLSNVQTAGGLLIAPRNTGVLTRTTQSTVRVFAK